MAGRLGPLRWSDLGSRRPLPAADPGAVAKWMAAAADRMWAAAGRPDPWTLVVVSADSGELGAAFSGCHPRCAPALRYVYVVPDPRALAARVRLEEPAHLYPVGPGDDPDEPAPPVQGVGPLCTALREPPALAGPGAVVAVGHLTRLPFDLYDRGPAGWSEVRLAATGSGFEEVTSTPGDGPLPSLPGAAAAPPGRYVHLVGAERWLRSHVPSPGSQLVVVDRWEVSTRPLGTGGPPAGSESGPPLALDQLAAVRRPSPAGPGAAAGDAGLLEAVAGGLSAVTWKPSAGSR